MASYVRNISTKNYQNLIIGFQVTVENVGDAFLEQCTIQEQHIPKSQQAPITVKIKITHTTQCPKKCPTFSFFIFSPNINRFSKFFH